jgi:capsular polysaccharide biosynthesis protein
MYQTFCTPNFPKPTNAKIKLYQRTENLFPRTIVNIQEVVDLLQTFTSFPVEVVTTTEKMTIQEQIRIFNNFDILVTTHGSHLTNGLFTMHSYSKAIIEMVPFLYDNIFYKNYLNDLSFAEYVVSTGHLTPYPINNGGNKTGFCGFLKYSDFQTRNCKLSEVSNPPR